MNDQNLIDYLRTDGLLTVALTMTGEAVGDAQDGSSIEERLAVGCVIRNRLQERPKQFGGTWADVCLKPWQFSCWNVGDPNRRRLLAAADAWFADPSTAGRQDPRLVETLHLAAGIINGAIIDITRGATHYFNPRAVPAPAWAYTDKSKKTLRTPDAVVGSHQFYAGVP
jgi:spore germination cell wall hydrolase CwlJ-like protein